MMVKFGRVARTSSVHLQIRDINLQQHFRLCHLYRFLTTTCTEEPGIMLCWYGHLLQVLSSS